MKPINDLTIITIKQPDIVDFSKVRNRALKKAKTNWVMFLDSDEEITPQLETELRSVLKNPQYNAYSFYRRDTFMGRELKYSENGCSCFVRLAKREWGEWERPVHEVWVGEGRVGKFKSPILHHPHQSLSTFLEKINLYTTLEAEYRFYIGTKATLFHIIFFPPIKFFYNYLFKCGFLDGVPGTIMAIMMSWHSFLTWTKLYLLWQKK
jgi:glycosyltransferase involved in cell wall biosynthesis